MGQLKELQVLVGAGAAPADALDSCCACPAEGGAQRREALRRDGKLRGQTLSQETVRLADWTMLSTAVPAKQLRFEEALVRLPRTLAHGGARQPLETVWPDR